VRISRTGTTDLRYFKAYDLPTYFPNLPAEEREGSIAIISAQMFFFLKDLAHKHQHHDQKTDTVTDLYPISALKEADFEWRIATLYGIYRKVIEYKRNSKVSQFNDCLGLIAYSETFRKISQQELGKKWAKRMPYYYTEELSQSIMATQSKIERQLSQSRTNSDSRRNFFIAGLGLVISYLGLLQLAGYQLPHRVTPPIYTVHLLIWSLRSPIKCFTVLVLFFLSWNWAFITWQEANVEIILLRLLASFPRNVTLAILLIVVFTFGSICILIIHPSVASYASELIHFLHLKIMDSNGHS
jgi:hypothetical protein